MVRIAVVMFLVAAVAITLWLWRGDAPSGTVSDEQAVATEDDMAPPLDAEEPDKASEELATIDGEAEFGSYQDWLDSLTPTEFAELSSWMESHGFFGALEGERGMLSQHFGDYGTYSVEALRELANSSNDPKAQLILGWRLSESGDHEQARPYLEQAAINGYTAPLHRIRDFHRDQARNPQLSDEEQREHREQELAWLEVMNRRMAPMSDFERQAQSIMQESGIITSVPEVDTDSVDALAEQFYDELEQRRLQQGKGAFSNQRPPMGDAFERNLEPMLDELRKEVAAITEAQSQ